MTVFQVVFGLAVFTLTRQYYLQDSDNIRAKPTPSSTSPAPSTDTNPTQLGLPGSSQSILDDPALLSRQANESFANKQYNRAAELYEQLVALSPNNVTAYNNLGITLHYLGRSTEALQRLHEGVAVDPKFQRLWLTLGYVNSALGDTEQARSALTTAVEMGTDNEVGQSALQMLESLPEYRLPLVDSH